MKAIFSNVSISDRNEWPIRPEELILELSSPGRTALAPYLPVRNPERSANWANHDVASVTVNQLNNFYEKLVPEFRESPLGIPISAQSVRKPIGPGWISDARLTADPLTYSQFEGYSLRYLTGTLRSFWNDIDESRRFLGIKDSCIEDLVAVRAEACRSGNYENWQEFQATIALPIYKELRSRGYSHRDLVG